MNNKEKHFLDFINSKGTALDKMNSGSDEKALTVADAIKAIELLKELQIPVFGGDVLSCKSNKLIYAYQYWGSEYHSLNWHCDRRENESTITYCQRCYDVAYKAINLAKETADNLEKDCFIVLVYDELNS